MSWKRKAIFGLGLTILFFSSRLVYLTKIPIFTDEAIYIRWGQIALQDPAQRFISLEDGKQPLFIWLMLPFLKFIPDPLLAGRLVSVLAGLLTLMGLIAISWKLFNEKIGWLTGLIYIISPFFLLYDRLALYDSLTTATIIWSLFFAILMVTKLRLDTALLFGMSVGAGYLTKSSAQFVLMLLPTTLILTVNKWNKTNFKNNFLKWLSLSLISICLSISISFILRLAPLFHMIKLKNYTFIYSLSEIIRDPLMHLSGNLRGLTDWTMNYLTASFLFFLVTGIILGMKKFSNKIIFLLLWFIIPFLGLATFGKVLYPRFILFMIAPLLPLIALGLNKVPEFINNLTSQLDFRLRYCLLFTVYCLLISYPVYFSSQLIFNPLNAPLPLVDRNQLLDDWPSGYGIPEIIKILNEKSRNKEIFVGTEGTFGLTPTALIIYLKDNPNIQIKGYWPISQGISELVEIAKTGKETYILFKDTQILPPDWPLSEIARFRKGRGNVYSILWKINL